ncbi:unnamed protein product [Pleuronectes platessa]|uniref:Uncharacterized protein n=1 Tax=Pleuronectes platessa TaxID=8262 RepID=A0A9N7V7K6_PLEPL|nr:unnamed protein product [Pleuronectes platessa]
MAATPVVCSHAFAVDGEGVLLRSGAVSNEQRDGGEGERESEGGGGTLRDGHEGKVWWKKGAAVSATLSSARGGFCVALQEGVVSQRLYTLPSKTDSQPALAPDKTLRNPRERGGENLIRIINQEVVQSHLYSSHCSRQVALRREGGVFTPPPDAVCWCSSHIPKALFKASSSR